MLSLRFFSSRVSSQVSKGMGADSPSSFRGNTILPSPAASIQRKGACAFSACGNVTTLPSSIFQQKSFSLEKSLMEFSRSFSSSPAPRADLQQVIKRSQIDTQEAEIAKLIESQVSEIETMAEFQEYKQTLAQLAEAGVVISENEEGAVLTSENNGREIRIEWDPSIILRPKQMPDEEPGADLQRIQEKGQVPDEEFEEHFPPQKADHEVQQQQQQEAENGQEHEHEHEHGQQGGEEEIELKITITKGGKKLHATASIANDGLLYIYHFGINESKMVDVELLAEDFQQKLYDYFDGVGVGDSTSNFILQYNTFGSLTRNLEGLNLVKEEFL